MVINWPDQYDRTASKDRRSYPHNFRVGTTEAFKNILTEVNRMSGVTAVRIDTAVDHQSEQPNIPQEGSNPDDPGVVVRFNRNGEQYIVPCDRWSSLRDNAQAIARYIEAKRALDRYGVETLESEFGVQKARVD